MSWTIILHEKIKTARKEYDCCAQEWLTAEGEANIADDYKFSFADKRKLVKIMREKYKILPGDKYIEQVGIYEGGFACLQCRIDVAELCKKYDLWCE